VLLIKEITASDRQRVESIARALHPQWFTESALEEIANAVQTQNGYLAVDDGRPVGFAAYLSRDDDRTAELTWIGVHPDFHRRGIGRRLVISIEEELKRKACGRLEVYTVAATVEYEPYARTRSFYHAVGFTDLGVEPKGFPSGDDRLLLIKRLE
jgi:GNAT superfamily N-acetyltransferase